MARYVRTQAGAARYGLNIGDQLPSRGSRGDSAGGSGGGTFRQRPVGREVAGLVAETVVQQIVFVAEREAKTLVPVDVGTLKASINGKVEVRGQRVHGILGTQVEYAAPVEFGTHSAGEPGAPGKKSNAPGGMPPRPYLRPGLAAGIAHARQRGLIR